MSSWHNKKEKTMEAKQYEIAGLKVLMTATEPRTVTQSAAYLKPFSGEPDIVIAPDPEKMREAWKSFPELSFDEMEYMVTAALFYRRFLPFGGMLLHSSCVVTGGKAYLFSAPSGTGKSTHTALWMRYLGKEADILNDDKPAIRLENGELFAYGTPWSGKTDQNINARYPIGGIAFIERSKSPFIKPMDTACALRNLYWQTVKPRDEENLDRVFALCEAIIKQVPIWQFGCDISEESFRLSFETMTAGKGE